MGVEQRKGYIVYDCGEVYQVEVLSVYTDERDWKVRIYKEDLPDITNYMQICKIAGAIEDGAMRGSTFYKCKWYNHELINKIQEKNGNYNWKYYVK